MPIPWLPIVLGMQALSGILGGRKAARTGTTDITTTGTETSGVTGRETQTFDLSTLPQLMPEIQKLISPLSSILMQRLTSPIDLAGYTGAGIKNINQAAEARTKALNQVLASRGLTYSPTAGVANIAAESGRLSDISNFVSQLPMLQRQMQGEDINNLLNLIRAVPVGERKTGTQIDDIIRNITSTSMGRRYGVGVEPGSVLAEGVSVPSSLLAALYGLGKIPKTWGGFLGGTP